MHRTGNSDYGFINDLSTRAEVNFTGLPEASNSVEKLKKLQQKFQSGFGGEE